MPLGTLCIARLAAQFETFCVTFVPYDATSPETTTIRGGDSVRGFLESLHLDAADQRRAMLESEAAGITLLMNVDMAVPMLREARPKWFASDRSERPAAQRLPYRSR